MKTTKSALIASLDDFTRSYIGTALWASNDESNDQGGEPLDRNYDTDDLTLDCLNRMIKDCRDFQEQNSRALELANRHKNTSYEIGGHDFWLTRNHHGAGFWDRGLRLHLGEHLTKKAHEYGECSLYVQRGKVGIE